MSYSQVAKSRCYPAIRLRRSFCHLRFGFDYCVFSATYTSVDPIAFSIFRQRLVAYPERQD